MAEIVNLREVRKRKARADKQKVAETNRAKFGRTKNERARDEADLTKSSRDLEAHRLEETDD